MLTVLSKYNWDQYPGLMQGMFRLRHKVCYDKLGWEEVYSSSGLDKDETDHENTIYIVGTVDGHSDPVSCIRFTPTIHPNLSSVAFAELFLRGVPHSANVYDVSRILVDPATLHLSRRRSPAGEITLAWLEAGFAMPGVTFTGVCTTEKLHKYLSIGWNMRPLGLPTTWGEDELVATKITPTHQALLCLRKMYGRTGPVIDAEGRQHLKRFYEESLLAFATPEAAYH